MLDQIAVVTNDDARIILSNTAKYRTGALLREKTAEKSTQQQHPFQLMLMKSMT